MTKIMNVSGWLFPEHSAFLCYQQRFSWKRSIFLCNTYLENQATLQRKESFLSSQFLTYFGEFFFQKKCVWAFHELGEVCIVVDFKH